MDIPLAADDKGNILGFDGQQWRAPDGVASNDAGIKAYRFGDKWQIEPERGDEAVNTAAIAGAGVIKGASEGFNPVRVGQGAHAIVSNMFPFLKNAPGFAQAPAAAEQLAPKTQGADIALQMPGVSNFATAMKGLTGADMATAPRTPEAAANAAGAEMTPLRRLLAKTGEYTGAALPFMAMGGNPLSNLGWAAASGLGAGIGNEAGGKAGEMIGAFAPLLMRAGATGLARPKETAPTTEDMFASAGKDFDAFKASESAVTKDSFKGFVDKVEQRLQDVPYATRDLEKGSFALADKLKERLADPNVSGMTMGDLWGARRVMNERIGQAVRSGADTDAKILRGMKQDLDTYIGGLKNSKDALFGDVESAVPLMQRGISTYAKASAAKEIEDLVEAARNRSGTYITGRALDQALRVEFRKIANNPDQLRRFAPEVQDAITQVAQGTAGRNVLSFLGRFSPTKVIPGMGFAAAAMHNPLLAVPGGIAAAAASGAAGRLGVKQANQAATLARGYVPPPPMDWMSFALNSAPTFSAANARGILGR